MDDAKLVERVNELLSYDPEAGVFRWKVSRSRTKVGSVAGTFDTDGYVQISIDRKKYGAHRLAFILIHGFLPEQIDHINEIKGDNRIVNLRAATRQQNKQNVGKHLNNTTGYKGVSFNKRVGKYRAQAKQNGKVIHLGYMETAAEAFELYKDFAELHHGEFIHHTV